MIKRSERSPKASESVLKRSYDLIVVGNDPAGVFCANAVASEGYSVLILDSAAPTVLCPEWTAKPLFDQMFLPIHGRGSRDLFIQETDEIVYDQENGRKQTVQLRGQVYDRNTLDQNLASLARNQGVQFLRGAFFRGLIEGGIEIDFAGETVPLKAQCIVAADGIRSPIRTHLGLKQDHFLAFHQYRVRLRKPTQTVNFWGNAKSDEGLGWLIPRVESANVGVGVLKQVAHLMMYKLHNLFDHLINEEIIESDELTHKTGGLIPVGGPFLPPGTDGIFLLGDAAGLRDPLAPGIGIGLASGMISGWRVGEYIIEEFRHQRTPRINGYLQCLKPLIDNRIQLEASSRLGQMLDESEVAVSQK